MGSWQSIASLTIFGSVLAVLVVVAALPFLFKKIWQTELSNLDSLPQSNSH